MRHLEPANPTVEILSYTLASGDGVIEINGQTYEIRRTTRREYVALSRIDGRRGLVTYLVNVRLWHCPCHDATYNPTRPGGCKHVAALRDVVAPAIKAMRCEKVA